MYLNADEIRVESDERGFELYVMCDDGDPIRVNVQACAEQLYDSVKANIGPWLRERDEARGTWVYQSGADHAEFVPESGAGICSPQDVDESGGYAISNPKHPDYHSVHVDRH